MQDPRTGHESNVPLSRGVDPIDTLEALFFAELQELRSAELQLAAQLVGTAAELLKNDSLERLLRGYATELNSRREDIERILGAAGIDSREHSDQAMKSLLDELVKMSLLRVPLVRDAAFIDSLQRIVHVKIAGYGSVATFARTLGRTEDAARLAEYVDREKAIDAELTAIAICAARRAVVALVAMSAPSPEDRSTRH